MNALFPAKPWEFKGRRMERNAPSGTLCSKTPTCTSPRTTGYHCPVCHECFGGLSGFDRHRKDGWCLNPETLGMVLTDKGVWTQAVSAKASFPRARTRQDATKP